MKIYREKIFIRTIPDKKKIKGTLGSRLIGINITAQNAPVQIEPIYSPLIEVSKIGNVICVSFYFKPELALAVFLMPDWPFISFQIIQSMSLDPEPK